jgi:hypothetical protein
MNRARTYHCTRMRHCIEQSNGLVSSLLCPSWVDCIIATRGYDFRKGHLASEIHEFRKQLDQWIDARVLLIKQSPEGRDLPVEALRTMATKGVGCPCTVVLNLLEANG